MVMSLWHTEADPDIEEGGAYIELEWGWCGHAVFCVCIIMQSVVGGSGGMLPPKNF